MKSLFQTVKTQAPAPEPVPETVRVAHDAERVQRDIPGAELADWLSRGWRLIPSGTTAHVSGEPLPDADDPAPDERALWDTAKVRAAGSQNGQWAAMTSFA